MKWIPTWSMNMKLLIAKGGRQFFIRDEKKDLHTQFGYIKSQEIIDAEPGAILKTNTGKEMIILDSNFGDAYKKIKRGAQIIPLKDVGAIITEVGLEPNWKIVDSGSGSGALALFMANLVPRGKVYTYDIRDDHIVIVQKNIEFLNLKNIQCKKNNVYEKIPIKNVDLITFDLPEPWEATANAHKALKPGGYLVSYSPCIPQVADFVNNLPEGMAHIKTVEIIEREWDVIGRKVRPKTAAIGHSGFLTYVRKLH